MNSFNIKCIGFSVTGYGSPSYPQRLQKVFEDNGANVSVTYAALGGLSIDALPYLLPLAMKGEAPNLVVLEIATSWFSLQSKDINLASKYVKCIVDYFESLAIPIAFLNLYRRDLDDQDIVVSAIDAINNGRYQVIDLKKKYRDMLNVSNVDHTTDGVHPSGVAIDEIAREIFLNLKINNLRSAACDRFKSLAIDLIKPPAGSDYFEFNNKHGIVVDGIKIKQGGDFQLLFESPVNIAGVFFIYGPDTNIVEINIGGETIEVPMKDGMSFYRRIGYRAINRTALGVMTVSHPHRRCNTVLQRDSWEKVDFLSNYIVGFSVVI
jgi:lysophospholipase L1-like esterase